MKKDKKSKSSKWEYFDDCGICQAMKGADERGYDLSMQELRQAFDTTNVKRSSSNLGKSGKSVLKSIGRGAKQ